MPWSLFCSRLLLPFIGLFLSCSVAASERLLWVNAANQSKVMLGPHLLVKNLSTDQRWRNLDPSLTLGFSQHKYRLDAAFAVIHGSDETQWYLDLNSGNLGHIAVQHWVNDELAASFHTGTLHNFDTRAVAQHHFAFPLTLSAGRHRLQIEIDSRASVALLPVLESSQEWLANLVGEQLLLGAVLGSLLILALYNIVIFGVTRELVFGLFGLSCLAGALWRASDVGMLAQFAFADMPSWNQPVTRVAAGTYIACLLLFLCEYLRLDSVNPRLVAVTKGLSGVIFVLLLFPIFSTFPGVGMAVLALCPMAAMAMAIVGWRHAQPGSGIVLISVGVICATGLVSIAKLQGWIPLSVYTNYATEFSILGLSLLTSSALAGRLSQAKQLRHEAVTATQNKSLLLANMSHEIRTPLSAIVGFSDLLSGSNLTREQQRFTQRIEAASRTLLGIIDDILDLSRLESGRLDLDREPVAVQSLMTNVREHFSFTAQERDLLFTVEQDHGVPEYFLGDELRLGQILTNLVGNAITFTNKGSVSVRLSAEPRAVSPAGDTLQLRIVVSDTGAGLTRVATAETVYAVLSGERFYLASIWRHRSWSGHLQTAGGGHGW